MNTPAQSLFGWLLCFALIPLNAHGQAEVALINTGSVTGRITIELPGETAAGLSAGDRLVAADGRQALVGGQDEAKFAVARLNPMETVVFRPDDGPAPMWVKATRQGGVTTVASDHALYTFGGTGLHEVATGSSDTLKVKTSLPDEAETQLVKGTSKSDAAVSLITSVADRTLARWTVLADGTLRVTAYGSMRIELPGRGFQAWRFGAVQSPGNRLVGYHVHELPAPMNEPFIQTLFHRVTFETPLTWAALLPQGDPAEGRRGIAMSAARGDVVFLPPGPLRPTQIKPGGSDQITVRERGVIEFKGTAQSPATLMLAAADSINTVKQWSIRLGAGLALTQTPDGWSGRVRDATVRVDDGNANGMPDLQGDRWHWSRHGKTTAGFDLIPADEDPREEGNALHIVRDADGDGTLSETEWSRPVWRLADRNRDGVYFEGSLLTGGRLEQDAVYHRASGSPDGRLWDRQVFALDLDGDGDQDLTVRKNMVNFTHAGQVGAHTAHNKNGVKFNFGDGDFALAVLPDLADGRVRIAPIDYDGGYFYRLNVDSSTAYALNDNGYWLLNEEHQEYEGFAPGNAAGHLWVWEGHVRRVIFGGINGGNWKLGVEPDGLPQRREPHEIAYTDPWGYSFRFVSIIKPTEWDGSALPVREIDGHLDYVPHGPWAWIVDQDVATRSVIQPPQSWGGTSIEAYVKPIEPNSRTEWARAGRTSYVLYYSPLMRGLHHRGIHRGETLDGTLRYFDEDEDGIVDHYTHTPAGHTAPTKELWYDAQRKRITFRHGTRVVTWPAPDLTFPDAKMYLENFGDIEALYRRGDGRVAMVVEAAIDDRGRLTGVDAPNVTPAAPTTYPLMSTLIAGFAEHTGGLNYRGRFAMSEAMPIYHRLGYRLHLRNTPTDSQGGTVSNAPSWSERGLTGADVVVLQLPFAGATRKEVDALRLWVSGGGQLLLTLTDLEEATRFQANNLLAQLKIGDTRVIDRVIEQRYIPVRIADMGNIVGDIREERTPSAGNAVRHFGGDDHLIRDCAYLNVRGAVIEPDADASIWLTYRRAPLIVAEPLGDGRVILCGGPFASQELFAHPIHTYQRNDNPTLLLHLLQRVREAITKE